ncbi:MAG: DNA-binding protein [Thiomonas arsenitoxydans]|jgi:chromosome segregation ATPase|nr:DNA-binding protein [Thiomonas arsenitoxydans]
MNIKTDAIKERIAALPSRSEKARAVAAWLFFEQGEYPSAARVREIIGIGSMTDLSRDLRAFWDEVRSRMKTRITSPDLPQEIVDSVGEFISAVWSLAQDQARTQLDDERRKTEDQMAALRQDVLQLQAQAQSAKDHAQVLQDRVDRLQAAAEEDAARSATLQERVDALLRERAEADQQHAIALAEKDQTVESLHQRMREREATAQQQIEAAAGELRFAKMQIENARGEGRHWKSEFDRERSESTLRISVLEQRMNATREEAGGWRIKAQDAQDKSAALQEQIARLQEQLRALRVVRKLAQRTVR